MPEKACVVSDDGTSENALNEAEQKGREFENWVVEHFNRKYFEIIEWRGDKYHKGAYAASNTYPDLELALQLHGKKYDFAVECKYRSQWNGEGVEWADEQNVKNYNEFAKKKNIPVIIVIGIGGTPCDPENVFCCPLDKMQYTWAKKAHLEKFRREEKDKSFFYDTEKFVLK